jgi:hypothetical protein
MEIRYQEITDRDIHVIKGQLNTETVDATGIIERCKYQYPVLILLIPVDRVQAPDKQNEREREALFRGIANVIWLTCPYLNRKIHDLETAGYIDAISDLIDRADEYGTLMRRANAEFFYMRRSFLKRCCMDWDEGFISEVSNAGIGGIRDIKHLKCLHIHYAHYMICEDNLAGRITRQLLGEYNHCSDSRCDKFGNED